MPSLTKILTEFDPTPDNLLPALKKFNKSSGYVDENEARSLADYFSVPLSRVYEVATFFDMIKTKKPAAIIIQVCSSTFCATSGAYTLIKEIEDTLKIKAGDQFNPKVKLEKTSCLGHCDEGPVMLVNGKLYARVTKSSVHAILAEIYG